MFGYFRGTAFRHAAAGARPGATIRAASARQLHTGAARTTPTKRAVGLVGVVLSAGAARSVALAAAAKPAADAKTKDQKEDPKKEDVKKEDTDEPEPERSQRRFESVDQPGLTVLVADAIQEVVYDSKRDVLVDVYADWCSTCKLLNVVIGQVAYALDDCDTTTVASMNGSKNYKKDFLTAEEDKYFPTVKIFPANKSTPLEYQGSKNAHDILRWLHAHSTHKFDLERALKRADEKQPEVWAKLEGMVEKMVHEELPQRITSENLHKVEVLWTVSPCYDVMFESFKQFRLAMHRQGGGDEHLSKAMQPLVECMQKPVNLQFWTKVEEVAKKQKEMSTKHGDEDKPATKK